MRKEASYMRKEASYMRKEASYKCVKHRCMSEQSDVCVQTHVIPIKSRGVCVKPSCMCTRPFNTHIV